jgi:hypothetical protein
MKKISIIGAALVLQVCVISCKNNPSDRSTRTVASVEPVTAIDTPYHYNDDIGFTTGTTTTISDGIGTASAWNQSESSRTGTASTSDLCGGTEKRTAFKSTRHTYRHKVAVRRPRKATVITEDRVVVAQNTPIETNITTESVITPPSPIIYEKQSEFTGNYPVAAAPAKRRAVHFAPEAGFNLNNMYVKEHHYENSNMLKAGFHVGVMMDAAVGKHGAIQPELRYIMKGGELTSKTANQERKDKLTLHYVEMPVNIVYKTGTAGGNRFMVGAGPYVSALVNAQSKTKIKTTTSNFEDGTTSTDGQHSLPISHKDAPGNMQRFDYGANCFVGYEMASGTFLKAGGEVGLRDLQQSQIDGKFYNRNYNFLFTVGHLIGNNK